MDSIRTKRGLDMATTTLPMQQGQQDKLALVLGATGGIGGEVARQLREAGWQVRALHRRAAQMARAGDGIDWQQGDAVDRASVMRAARGCAVIVHAVNPPGYRNWAKLVLPMIGNTIAAAQAAGATIVLPGTVYNYGPDAFPTLVEDQPQRPQTRKGAIASSWSGSCKRRCHRVCARSSSGLAISSARVLPAIAGLPKGSCRLADRSMSYGCLGGPASGINGPMFQTWRAPCSL